MRSEVAEALGDFKRTEFDPDEIIAKMENEKKEHEKNGSDRTQYMSEIAFIPQEQEFFERCFTTRV